MLAGAVSAEPWLTSWDQAVKASKQSGKPILMDFTGSDWCIWCKKLDKEVFDTPQFGDWAAKKVVLLKVDFPKGTPQSDELKAQNAKLQEKYNVQGFPTVMFVTAQGKVLDEYGYDAGGPTVWTQKADKKLAPK